MNARVVPRPLIVIAGPTGSGKSALAIHLAQNLGGEIINCDSLQLYRGFDIGTAKTPVTERGGIPHHLFDVLTPRESYSAGQYARAAREAVAEISARDRLPVVVGGTGFYLRALLDGLPTLPERDLPLRERLIAREQARPGVLHRILRRLDPSAARRIHSNDLQKTLRALELRLLTRRPVPPSAEALPLQGYRTLKIGLDPDRALLQSRLAARTSHMFECGLIAEVEALLAQGCTGHEKPFESLGYKQALLYLAGSLSMKEAIESTLVQTRQYAKRQWTWFRRDPEIYWLSGFGDQPAILEAAEAITRQHISASC
jgi:tRNA dimethylallyltransferase